MSPEFLFTLEDPDNPLAISVYNHPTNQDKIMWLKIGRGVLEIPNQEFLNALIDILQYTKQELKEEDEIPE